jgi:peptidoglycan/xylan/chitin deacetylase (PgdA/CDA1 family)
MYVEKQLSAKILAGLAGIWPFSALAKSMGQRLIAPFYHAVSDQPLPHIRHLYQLKTVRQFEDDLDFLLRHYTPVDFHQLPAIVENKRKVPGKPPMLLSFDDGLREFYDPIAPILLRKGIPAICFINSGFLDNTDLFFRYKASLLIDALQKCPDAVLLKQIRHTRYADRAQLDLLAQNMGLDFGAFLREQQPYLSSVQVASLLQKGFHFGAHSVDHPEYRLLDQQEQLRQTTKSVETISNKFGLGYRLFSFPFTDFGVSKKFFDVVLEEKKIADFTFGCAGIKTDVNARHIQRIPLEIGDLSAEAILRKELLYFWLKMPFGKNRIHRK